MLNGTLSEITRFEREIAPSPSPAWAAKLDKILPSSICKEKETINIHSNKLM